MVSPVAIERFREELACAICHELCTVPKTLECLHTFCEECLEKWVAAKKQIQRPDKDDTSFLRHFECPKCCTPSDLSDGPSSLRTNFTFNSLIGHLKMLDRLNTAEQVNCGQCVEEKNPADSFCNSCETPLCAFHVDVHRKSRDYVDHTLVPLEEVGAQGFDERKRTGSKSLAGNSCPRHNDQFRWFCRTCELPICSACTVVDHRDHSFDWIDEEMAGEEREFIKESFTPIEEMIPTVTRCCTELQACQQRLTTSKEKLEEEIRRITEQRLRELKGERTLLESRVDDIFVSAKKALDHQLTEVEQMRDNLVNSLEFMKTTVESATDINLLMSKNQLMARSDTLQEMYRTADLSVPEGMGDICSQYMLTSSPVSLGSVRERTKRIKCELKPSTIKQGTELSMRVTTYGMLDKPLKRGGANCEAYLVHHNEASAQSVTMPCSVSDHSDGSYTVRCTPTGYGRGKITVQFNSDLAQQTTMDVNIVRSYEPLRSNPVAIDLRCSPWGVTLLRDNQLAVSTSEKDVRIFDINTHQQVAAIHSNFVRPYAMTEDREGNLWVTDREAHNIQKFSREGGSWTKVLQFGTRGREEGKFAHPRGIAVHPNSGLIYIADMKNHRVQVFCEDQRQNILRQVNTFGSHGTGRGQFDQPASLVFNKRGQLVVCDDRNGRLQLFTHEGSHIECQGISQTGVGLLCSPIGIAIDSQGRYIIGEFGCHAVSFLSPKGKILSCVRSAGGAVGEFMHPRGVAVDSRGRIYVADFEHKRVVIL